MNVIDHQTQMDHNGFAIIPVIYDETELESIELLTDEVLRLKKLTSKRNDIFGIRQFLEIAPELGSLLYNNKLKEVLQATQSNNPRLVKAIYFDKPEGSNWFVAYHQDLSINVRERVDVPGFKNWTNKKGLISVHPPLEYLQATTTVRIHLDETDEKNGALRVIPASHTNGIQGAEGLSIEQEVSCPVTRGGVMLMKPLLMHASSRSCNMRRRRVIHLEFCSKELPDPLQWKEELLLASL